MSTNERLRLALDRLDSAAREQRERRALAERRLVETETKARAAFQKEIDAAMKYADHLAELNRRKQEAGGWATEKTLSDKNNVMGFGPDEAPEEPAEAEPSSAAIDHPGATAASPAPHGRHARRDDVDDEDLSTTSWLV